MTEHHMTRCPSCDTANPAHATFCTHCGKPMGSGGAAEPSGMYASDVGGADGSGLKGYMIAAAAVAAVLVVGGALVFFADDDGPDDTLLVTSSSVSAPAAAVSTTPAVTATSVPAPTVPPTTVPLSPAPAPTDPLTSPPRATIPPAPPPTPAPAPAPEPTAAPRPSGTLSFAQADSFYRSYIATAISGEFTAAWNMLSSSDQADYPNGFDQFVGFWRSVSFADVQRVESVGASDGFQALAVDMAYGQVDGTSTSFEVIEVDVNVRPDGSFQIFDYRYIRNQ